MSQKREASKKLAIKAASFERKGFFPQAAQMWNSALQRIEQAINYLTHDDVSYKEDRNYYKARRNHCMTIVDEDDE